MGLLPPILTAQHGWSQRRPHSNSQDGEPLPNQSLPYPLGLHLRLMRRRSEMFLRPRPSELSSSQPLSLVEPIGSA